MNVKKALIKTGLKFKKHSPEICIIGGLGCLIGAVVTAYSASLKADNFINDLKEDMDEINQIKNNEEYKDQYTESDYKRDKMIIYTRTGVNIGKSYALTAGLVITGSLLILSGYGIIKRRYATVSAAYYTLNDLFQRYRSRVVEELGAAKDTEYLYGTRQEKIEVVETNEKGKEKKRVEIENFLPSEDPKVYSQYAKFFDESCSQWRKDPEFNLTFLTQMQRVFNERLHSNGHVFLNEVYDALGIPRTSDGALVGWIEGEGDDFIDFGIYLGSVPSRKFVNGYERTILLDFNVDGVIYDKI